MSEEQFHSASAGNDLPKESTTFPFIPPAPPRVWTSFVTPFAIWLGYIAWRTNSIGPGIACHAFVNGGLNIWRLIAKFGELSDTLQHVCNSIFVLIGTACFLLTLKLLAKREASSTSDVDGPNQVRAT